MNIMLDVNYTSTEKRLRSSRATPCAKALKPPCLPRLASPASLRPGPVLGLPEAPTSPQEHTLSIPLGRSSWCPKRSFPAHNSSLPLATSRYQLS